LFCFNDVSFKQPNADKTLEKQVFDSNKESDKSSDKSSDSESYYSEASENELDEQYLNLLLKQAD